MPMSLNLLMFYSLFHLVFTHPYSKFLRLFYIKCLLIGTQVPCHKHLNIFYCTTDCVSVTLHIPSHHCQIHSIDSKPFTLALL